MLNVFLLRHGETEWNADGNKYCGRTDIGLTEKGVGQAQLVQQQLSNIQFDAIYSSPLQRAYFTAQMAGGDQRQVIKDERLIEADFGAWEGLTREQFISANGKLWADWSADPAISRAGGTGETATEVIGRVDSFFAEVQQRHPSGTILVVAHNGVNRFYLAWKLGMALKNYRRIAQENSSLTQFTLDEQGEITLMKLNSKGL